MKWTILLIAIAANTAAALLIKLATAPGKSFPSLVPFNLAFSNWALWLGLFIYGLALATYIWALSVFPVSVAHPVITAGGIALVSSIALFAFSEKITFLGVAGIATVAIGVILIALGSKG